MTQSVQELPEGASFRLAFEKHLPALNQLKEDELKRPTVDIPSFVTRMLRALPALRSLRAQILKKLPEHDVSLFDELESRLFALAHTHALSLVAPERSSEDLIALHARASELREELLADARHLARHKLLDAQRLADIKGLAGYSNVSFDLLALATLMRQSWGALIGKTPLTFDKIELAESLAQQEIALLALRDQPAGGSVDATQLRQRAFTHFLLAYNETRRAVTYVRWNEDDVDTFCPPLSLGKRGRHTESEEPGEPEAPTDEPASPVAQPAAPVAPVKPGMPGSSPFSK